MARDGKATQKNTAYGGDASKAIDGNKSGNFSDGGETHTEENTQNPWWEVDLGAERPITSIAVYNRTDGGLGKRLDGFTLKVLDKDHKVVYEKKNIPAPAEKGVYEVGSESPEIARPPRGHERPAVGARQGDRHLQGARAVRRQGRRP